MVCKRTDTATHPVLVVKVNIRHLEITQRLFDAFAYIVRLARYAHATVLKIRSELSTDKDFGAELWVLKELSEESLVLSLRRVLVIA